LGFGVSLTPGLSTARKLAVARWLFHLVVALRVLGGRRGTEVVCRRRGVRWRLDLREGVQLALYLGVYERTTGRRLLEFVEPGNLVVDVGANVGAHSLPLARAVGRAGRLVAIEPTDVAFARLRENCRLNPELVDRVVLVHAAVGAPGATVEAAYHSTWPVVPAASRHPIHCGVEQPATHAGFSTLDDLLDSLAMRSVALIKIDVDGRELDVLRGVTRTLHRDRPVVVFELCPYLLTERAQSADELVAFFAAHDYELLDEDTLRPIVPDTARMLAGIPAGGSRNLVARARAAPVRMSTDR
jgi:FkbM family methyltransferase